MANTYKWSIQVSFAYFWNRIVENQSTELKVSLSYHMQSSIAGMLAAHYFASNCSSGDQPSKKRHFSLHGGLSHAFFLVASPSSASYKYLANKWHSLSNTGNQHVHYVAYPLVRTCMYWYRTSPLTLNLKAYLHLSQIQSTLISHLTPSTRSMDLD